MEAGFWAGVGVSVGVFAFERIRQRLLGTPVSTEYLQNDEELFLELKKLGREKWRDLDVDLNELTLALDTICKHVVLEKPLAGDIVGNLRKEIFLLGVKSPLKTKCEELLNYSRRTLETNK